MNLELTSSTLIKEIHNTLMENSTINNAIRSKKDKSPIRNSTIIELALINLYENIHNKKDFDNLILNVSDLSDIEAPQVNYIDDINRIRRVELLNKLQRCNI